MHLDNSLESLNIEEIVSFFSEDCEIILLDIKLEGKAGVRKWLKWMLTRLKEIRFEPVIIMVENNFFFEEFIVKAILLDGSEVESKWAEVLIYENYKIKSLRLYFDRLDFANSIIKGPISKMIIKKIIKESTKGLV
ncbi:MAG TPA: nuclear transport factor 2 family protein [candidate division Zixibacteria bacterium]|nr:nuclear transport factor 2 family protein [candidate division Zixibacteria bacterium]